MLINVSQRGRHDDLAIQGAPRPNRISSNSVRCAHIRHISLKGHSTRATSQRHQPTRGSHDLTRPGHKTVVDSPTLVPILHSRLPHLPAGLNTSTRHRFDVTVDGLQSVRRHLRSSRPRRRPCRRGAARAVDVGALSGSPALLSRCVIHTVELPCTLYAHGRTSTELPPPSSTSLRPDIHRRRQRRGRTQH